MKERLQAYLKNSYAPYSNLHFVCIVQSVDGEEYVGVNVENASFGGTICAERNAINQAVSQGKKKFKALYLMTDADRILTPCAICQQTFLEFFDADVAFILMNTKGAVKHYTYEEILRTKFTSKDVL